MELLFFVICIAEKVFFFVTCTLAESHPFTILATLTHGKGLNIPCLACFLILVGVGICLKIELFLPIASNGGGSGELLSAALWAKKRQKKVKKCIFL